ncbi:MAG: ribosome silencing factor [Rhizobiaceae bacterium]
MQTRGATRRAAAKISTAVEVSAEDILQTVLTSLDDSKAEQTVNINIKGKSALGDYMVITSGRSHRHVGAIADHLLRDLKEKGHGNARVEGLPACDWVLIDTGDVVVHVFRPEVREFYGIEKMWQVPEPASQTGVN